MNLEKDTKSWSWKAAVKKLSRLYQRQMRKIEIDNDRGVQQRSKR